MGWRLYGQRFNSKKKHELIIQTNLGNEMTIANASDEAEKKWIKNPIIPGFFPDPSIIRVNEDFYIVTSSFEYFPSIPIWHSRDLINWRQIGNVVDRVDQGLDLSVVTQSGGVQAATIRHHNGVFYVSSTRVNPEWPRSDYHFIVTATDINGPWSKCHYIQDAPGIDSSLFFDNGKAYFLANRAKGKATDQVNAEIWLSEIDLETFTLVGEKHILWDGTGGIFPEGPRMYKRNGFYYLLIAEGGTLHFHTTSIARSENVTGPFVSTPRNPVLTHKHLAREYPIQNVGHADMVELADGSWWGVALGSRPRGGFYDGGNTIHTFGGYYRNLGRETFIFPITWPADDLSPLFTPETGRIVEAYEAPNLPNTSEPDLECDFSEQSLNVKWASIRDLNRDYFTRINDDELKLQLQSNFEDTFLGIRQNSWNFKCEVTVDFSQLQPGDVFGLTAYMKDDAYLLIEIERDQEITVNIRASSGEQPTKQVRTKLTSLNLQLAGDDQDYTFSVPELGLSQTLDGREISCDMTGTHTGVMLGFVGKSEFKTELILSNFSYIAVQKIEVSLSNRAYYELRSS